jgi:hypothetical protein
VRPASDLPSISRDAPREAGCGLPVIASFSLLASPNYGCPRNTGKCWVLPRIPWFTRLPPATPASRPRASMRVNQAFPARFTAPVLAPPAATAPRLAPTAIAPSARAPAAARTSMPRSAYFRRRRRARPMRLRFPRLSRRLRVSAQPRVLRFSPGSPARLPSRSD